MNIIYQDNFNAFKNTMYPMIKLDEGETLRWNNIPVEILLKLQEQGYLDMYFDINGDFVLMREKYAFTFDFKDSDIATALNALINANKPVAGIISIGTITNCQEFALVTNVFIASKDKVLDNGKDAMVESFIKSTYNNIDMLGIPEENKAEIKSVATNQLTEAIDRYLDAVADVEQATDENPMQDQNDQEKDEGIFIPARDIANKDTAHYVKTEDHIPDEVCANCVTCMAASIKNIYDKLPKKEADDFVERLHSYPFKYIVGYVESDIEFAKYCLVNMVTTNGTVNMMNHRRIPHENIKNIYYAPPELVEDIVNKSIEEYKKIYARTYDTPAKKPMNVKQAQVTSKSIITMDSLERYRNIINSSINYIVNLIKHDYNGNTTIITDNIKVIVDNFKDLSTFYIIRYNINGEFAFAANLGNNIYQDLLTKAVIPGNTIKSKIECTKDVLIFIFMNAINKLMQ